MAHSNQAKKRIRQAEKRTLENKAVGSRMRTEVKRVLTAVEAGDKEAASAALPSACKQVDKAAKTNVIHQNTAARKKSMLQRSVNRIS